MRFVIYVNAVTHGALIGLLIGLSSNPAVGVVLPVLLGVGGGLSVVAVLSGKSGVTTQGTTQLVSQVVRSWIPTAWCVSVVAAMLIGAGVRGAPTQKVDKAAAEAILDTIGEVDSTYVKRYPYLVIASRTFSTFDITDDQRTQLAKGLAKLDSHALADLVLSVRTRQSEQKRAIELFGELLRDSGNE